MWLLDKIAPLNFWERKQDTGIEREELKKVMSLLEIKNTAFILTGVRRAGKSILTKQILERKIKEGLEEEQTLYVNFEDEEIEAFIEKGIISKIYKEYREEINPKKEAIIVLDEVDKVPNWEMWARTIIDRQEKTKVIITGSGSKILTENRSLLTGRMIRYKLFPLSFSDFLRFKKKKIKKYKSYQKDLKEYLEYGAFPIVALNKERKQKIIWLQQTYEDILVKDIFIKFRLREELLLKKIAYLALNSVGKYVSIKKMRNTLKSIMKLSTSPTTISFYFEYFSISDMFFFVPMWSTNIKNQDQYPKKLYCVDTGFVNAITKSFPDNISAYMENAVFLNLLRSKIENPLIDVFYWKEYGKQEGKEVDFVIKEGLRVKEIIQVTYASSKDEIERREIKSLLKAYEVFKKDRPKLTIITWDYENKEEIDGKKVEFVPLWKWLLEK